MEQLPLSPTLAPKLPFDEDKGAEGALRQDGEYGGEPLNEIWVPSARPQASTGAMVHL